MCVNVSVQEDNLVEATEEFHLFLTSNDSAIQVIEPSVLEMSIINSDGEI